MREKIQSAIGRLETALKYGPDMQSSRDLCVADAVSLLSPGPKETMYQRLKAPNDRNGNPRRIYVVMFENGTISYVVDEGYAGRPTYLKGLTELPEIEVSPKVYREYLKSFPTGSHT